MKKQYFALVVYGIAVISCAAQSPQDVCKAMVDNAAHNISVSTSSNRYYSSLFKQYCKADGSTSESTTSGAASAIIGDLPIGLKGDHGDQKTQWETFCRTEKGLVEEESADANFASRVVSESLKSANECMRIATEHNASLTYDIKTADRMVINLGIPPGQSVTVNSINSGKNITCTGPDLKKGGVFTYGIGKKQPIDAMTAATSIVCDRSPWKSEDGQDHYRESAVFVDTSYGPLNIYWPEDASLPLMTAAKMQNLIGSVSGDLTTLQTKTDQFANKVNTAITFEGSTAKFLGDVFMDNRQHLSCAWRSVGGDKSHNPQAKGNFCAAGEVIATIDLDACGDGGGCPVIGQVLCCK